MSITATISSDRHDGLMTRCATKCYLQNDVKSFCEATVIQSTMTTSQESYPSAPTTSEYVHVEYDKWETFQLETAAKSKLTACHIRDLPVQPRDFQDFVRIQNEYQSNITFKDCI